MLNHPDLLAGVAHHRIDDWVRAASSRGYDGDGRPVGGTRSARRRRGRRPLMR